MKLSLLMIFTEFHLENSNRRGMSALLELPGHAKISLSARVPYSKQIDLCPLIRDDTNCRNTNCLLIFEGRASILFVEEAIEMFLGDVRLHTT